MNGRALHFSVSLRSAPFACALLGASLAVSAGCNDRADEVVEADSQRETTAVAYSTYPSADRVAETDDKARPVSDGIPESGAKSSGVGAMTSSAPTTGRASGDANPSSPATGSKATAPGATGPSGFADADTLRAPDRTNPPTSKAQTTTAEQQDREPASGAPADADLSPATLERRVREALADTGALALSKGQRSAIQVEAQADGRVVLRGRVTDRRLAQQVEEHVKTVAGVETVENLLKTDSDDRLAE